MRRLVEEGNDGAEERDLLAGVVMIRINPVEMGVGDLLGDLIGSPRRADKIGTTLNDVGFCGDAMSIFDQVASRHEAIISDIVGFDLSGD